MPVSASGDSATRAFDGQPQLVVPVECRRARRDQSEPLRFRGIERRADVAACSAVERRGVL